MCVCDEKRSLSSHDVNKQKKNNSIGIHCCGTIIVNIILGICRLKIFPKHAFNRTNPYAGLECLAFNHNMFIFFLKLLYTHGPLNKSAPITVLLALIANLEPP